jgi:Outer membrane protein beta-barrel domain
LKKITSVLVLATGLTLASAAVAPAQTGDPKVYVDLNIAGQTQSNTVVSSSTFSLYGETGGTSFSQTVGKGLVFDGGAGYFVRKNFAVGVAVSVFTRSPAASVSIATPDPIAFNSFTVLSASPKLTQTELGTHLKLAYLVPVNDKAAITIFAGPSIVRLSKEIASGSLVNGTPQIAVETQTGTGFGAHGGLDFSYLLTPHLGGGIFVRYLRANVDLPTVSGVKVGGFQGGLGVRLRF